MAQEGSSKDGVQRRRSRPPWQSSGYSLRVRALWAASRVARRASPGRPGCRMCYDGLLHTIQLRHLPARVRHYIRASLHTRSISRFSFAFCTRGLLYCCPWVSQSYTNIVTRIHVRWNGYVAVSCHFLQKYRIIPASKTRLPATTPRARPLMPRAGPFTSLSSCSLSLPAPSLTPSPYVASLSYVTLSQNHSAAAECRCAFSLMLNTSGDTFITMTLLQYSSSAFHIASSSSRHA